MTPIFWAWASQWGTNSVSRNVGRGTTVVLIDIPRSTFQRLPRGLLMNSPAPPVHHAISAFDQPNWPGSIPRILPLMNFSYQPSQALPAWLGRKRGRGDFLGGWTTVKRRLSHVKLLLFIFVNTVHAGLTWDKSPCWVAQWVQKCTESSAVGMLTYPFERLFNRLFANLTQHSGKNLTDVTRVKASTPPLCSKVFIEDFDRV